MECHLAGVRFSDPWVFISIRTAYSSDLPMNVERGWLLGVKELDDFRNEAVYRLVLTLLIIIDKQLAPAFSQHMIEVVKFYRRLLCLAASILASIFLKLSLEVPEHTHSLFTNDLVLYARVVFFDIAQIAHQLSIIFTCAVLYRAPDAALEFLAPLSLSFVYPRL